MKNLLITICLFISLSAFTNQNAYFFYNDNFFKIFPEEKEIYLLLKGKLSKKYKIVETKFFTFDSLPNEINKITAKYADGLFVMNDFLSPLILKSSNLSKMSKFKLFSYNLPQNTNASIPVFNVMIDNRLLKNKIISLCKKYSGKKDFSDCGLIINANDITAGTVMNQLSEGGYKLTVNMSPENSLNWITANKELKVIVFFAGKDNQVITQIESKELQKLKYVEIFTRYKDMVDFVKHRISIDWKKSFTSAIDSKDFSDFIKSDGIPRLKNFIIDKDVIIDN